MEKYQKSTRDERKNKEKNKTLKYFGSKKHIRIKIENIGKKNNQK